MRSNSFDGLMRAAAAIVALTAVMSLRIAAAENSQDEHTRITDWRAKRQASLTSETGWLTPVALYWLKDGENSFGRASDRAFSMDDAALAPDTGAFILTDGHVRYVAHASKMTFLGKPVTRLDLKSDADEKPTELVAGSLHFMLIERAGHLGIRVRDSVSPNRLQFKGLGYFPVAPTGISRRTSSAMCPSTAFRSSTFWACRRWRWRRPNTSNESANRWCAARRKRARFSAL